MKLTLYRHNLICPYTPNWEVTLDSFPKHIREMARFAKMVVFEEIPAGMKYPYKKILKDRNNDTKTNWQKLNSIWERYANRMGNFSRVHLEEDRFGLKKVTLER